jgi:thymidylate synthase
MIKADKYYKSNLFNIIYENGTFDENPRPRYSDGEPGNSKFITQVFEEYDISKGEFPITTLRNTAIKTGIKEVLWIYQKQSNSLDVAHEMGINWWDEWNVGDGTIGQRYGATIKRYDLMNKLLKSLKEDPFSRRHIINMYQENDMNETPGLHPCAFETIWSVRKNRCVYKSEDSNYQKDDFYYLDLTLNQRSNDYIMAGYINKIQYVALQMMVASHLGYKPGKFCHFVQNLHIYDRHMSASLEILNRSHLEKQPRIELISNKSFYDFTIDDFKIIDTEGIKKIESKLEIAI